MRSSLNSDLHCINGIGTTWNCFTVILSNVMEDVTWCHAICKAAQISRTMSKLWPRTDVYLPKYANITGNLENSITDVNTGQRQGSEYGVHTVLQAFRKIFAVLSSSFYINKIMDNKLIKLKST